MRGMTLVYLLGGIGTFIGAIAGAVAILRKLGPEINQVQVTSAQNLVAMAETTARMSKDQADRLLAQNKILDDRMTEYANHLGEAMSRIEELEEKARHVDELRREVSRLRGALDRTKEEKRLTSEENVKLRERVSHLEREIDRLDRAGTVEAHRVDAIADEDRAAQDVVNVAVDEHQEVQDEQINLTNGDS